ncbi:MAG: GFA family protein [Sphingomonadaceae bacterium]|nr:GFA family protein [Sphingomonadaceae bacterium]
MAAAVEVLDCNCSMCAKTGYLHLIVEKRDFRLLTDWSALTDYRFNSGTARHMFCSTCGIKSFYVPRSHPDAYSVNLRALDDVSGLAVTVTPYDGRNWETARAALGD